MQDYDFLPFPQHFQFGTAVSSFQVEGNAGDRKSDWDEFLEKNPGIVKPDEVGPQWWKKGKAEADIEQMVKLGMQTQRLSFEWARIEPEEGKFNDHAIKRYREIIDFLHSKKIEPMVTLNHYTLPNWIARKGSWESTYTVDAFARYVAHVAQSFPDVKTWLTINEPAVLVESGYLLPYFPPQKNGMFAAIRAHHNLLQAHKKAYKILKKEIPDAMISMAFSFRWYRPEAPRDLLERFYSYLVNYFDSLNYIDGVKDYIDFIGVNFYAGYYLNLNPSKIKLRIHGPASHSLNTIFFGEVKKRGAYVSDLGSPIVPGFFLEVLQTLNKRYHKPLIITENGIADRKDVHRPFYILVHLVSVWKAIQQGIDIRGYCLWSTVDNLEWLEGYREEFGLIHNDAVSGKRSLRKSAHLYSDIVTKRGIDIQKLLATYFTGEQKEKAKELIHHLFTHHGVIV